MYYHHECITLVNLNHSVLQPAIKSWQIVTRGTIFFFFLGCGYHLVKKLILFLLFTIHTVVSKTTLVCTTACNANTQYPKCFMLINLELCSSITVHKIVQMSLSGFDVRLSMHMVATPCISKGHEATLHVHY